MCRELTLEGSKKFCVFRASVVNKLLLAAKRSLNPVKWVTPGLLVFRHLGSLVSRPEAIKDQ
jgi:hypothetical protein